MNRVGPWQWLRQQPEAVQYGRRALWGAIAGIGGFSVVRYGFEQHVMALYALFGALPLVLFSQIPGRGWHRSRILLAALPAGLVLVTAGSLLAAHSWSAAVGLFVVAFTVSYLGVGGPGVGGLATSFQLYYLLPCFPPYAPDTLGQRLGGLAFGILFTALVDRLLPPGPLPVTYRSLLSDAVVTVADYSDSMARVTAGAALGDEVARCKAAAGQALLTTRLSRVDATERPTSASLRDRALIDTRAALRHIASQLDRLAARPHGTDADAAMILDRSAASLRRAAHVLTDGRAGPPESELSAALTGFWEVRGRDLAATSPRNLRRDAVVHATGGATLLLAEGARLSCGAPLDERWRRPGGPFPYAVISGPARWWRRLRVHLTPHSVLLQNALRGAIALAGARLIVGALDLPHGFWALLTTLSLMRTSASDTRGALLPAFLGTAAGAAVATAVVMLVGDVPSFYIAVTPVVFLVGFAVGPLLGPAWTQAALTVTLVVIFAQVIPTDVRLPAVRLMDVVIGGSIGAVASMLAWPRGARGELRRCAADLLDRSADGCLAVTERLGQRTSGEEPLRPAVRAMQLAQAAYTQHRTEKAAPHTPSWPWELAMSPGHTTVSGGQLLLGRNTASGVSLPEAAVTELTALARRVAADLARTAETVRRQQARAGRGRPATGSGTSVIRPPARARAADEYAAGESAALRYGARHPSAHSGPELLLIADVEAWLTGIAHEAALVEQGFTEAETRTGTGTGTGTGASGPSK
ncbi:FUSC family protein [Streptomyces xanthochromogenes]|uniref:FUSC family protein n=1 Tax=Streptomyces xanthochromogenes TaxID=67384 RepID=UPI0037FA4D7D